MFQPEKDFEEYGMFVFKYLMSLCGNADLAEELTQETFYRVIGRFVLWENLTEAARFPHGFAKLRSTSGIRNWTNGKEEKRSLCRRAALRMAWRVVIAEGSRRWK